MAMKPFPLISPPQREDLRDIIRNGPFPIRFPSSGQLEQDEEWCEVMIEGDWRRIRFHDYDEVYKIPGLYETIFYRTLKCDSPNRVTDLLRSVLQEVNVQPADLRVLDLGAGNGMAGEALQSLGTRKIVGVDIIPEAREAALRDRSWVYDDYYISDFTKPDAELLTRLNDYHFNTLVTVAALGFGDIPPEAFTTAFKLVAEGGLLAFNVRETFLSMGQKSGFSKLIYSMLEDGIIQMELYKRYQHRLSIHGEPIYYIGIVAQKLRDLA